MSVEALLHEAAYWEKRADTVASRPLLRKSAQIYRAKARELRAQAAKAKAVEEGAAA